MVLFSPLRSKSLATYKYHSVQRLHCPGSASLQSRAEHGWSSFPARLCSVSSAVCRNNCILKPHPCLLGAPLTSKHLQRLPMGSDCCSAACSCVSQTCSQMGLPLPKIIFFIRLGKLPASLILFGTCCLCFRSLQCLGKYIYSFLNLCSRLDTTLKFSSL